MRVGLRGLMRFKSLSPGIREGLVAITVGIFGDPTFPPPARSIFEDVKHPWIELRGEIEHYESGRPS
jgi:hypothetical protein